MWCGALVSRADVPIPKSSAPHLAEPELPWARAELHALRREGYSDIHRATSHAGTIPAWHFGSPVVYSATCFVAVAAGMDLLNF